MPQTDWKTTKRVLDWASVIHPINSGLPGETDTTGGDSDVEVASLGFPLEERSMEEATFPLFQPSREGIEVTRSMAPFHPRTASDVREHGNPAAPGHPDDLKNCDLAAMEEKLLGVMYATDDWIGPAWEENVHPSKYECVGREPTTR